MGFTDMAKAKGYKKALGQSFGMVGELCFRCNQVSEAFKATEASIARARQFGRVPLASWCHCRTATCSTQMFNIISSGRPEMVQSKRDASYVVAVDWDRDGDATIF